MSKTRAELIVDALNEIGWIGQEQTVSADASNRVSSFIPGVIKDLRDREIYYVDSDQTFDDAAALYLAIILGQMAAPKFMQASDVSRIEYAEQKLTTLARAGRYTRDTMELDRSVTRGFR